MREENPDQRELLEPQPSQAIEKAAELSEVAALSAKVIDHGLIREHRPVFVYDAKRAKEKTANAARQEKFRKKKLDQGFVASDIPIELADLLKAGVFDWKHVLDRVNPAPAAVGENLGEIKPTKSTAEEKITIKEVIVEVIKEVRIDVPGPTQIVEKIVEKQVSKFSSEQRKAYEIGVKVQKLTGWRARFLRFIL